jgi:hypothetical protein
MGFGIHPAVDGKRTIHLVYTIVLPAWFVKVGGKKTNGPIFKTVEGLDLSALASACPLSLGHTGVTY